MSDSTPPPSNAPAPPADKILYETKSGGRVAYITINNPTKRNSINMEMATAIIKYLKQADDTKKVKCVVINSTGDQAFCAGWDLSMFKEFNDQIKNDLLSIGTSVSRTIFFMKKPVIMQIQGSAVGAGCIMSLAADFRIVAKKENVFFQLPEMELNIPGATGPTVQSVAILGLARSKMMMLNAEKISAEQMDRWGLISKLVEPAELENEVKRLVKSMLEKNTGLLATQKAMCNIAHISAMKELYEMENEVAEYFFGNRMLDELPDLDGFLKKLWTKYGKGMP